MGVLSVTQDEWSDEEVDSMIEYASASSIYEAFVPEGSSKPGPDVSHDQRMRFIRSKYEHQEFLKPSLRITSGKACSTKKPSFLNSSISTKFMDSFRANSSSKKIVTVKKGTNLAIRDMMSSDPYVVLNLGKQKLQTTVVHSNLNPILLSVPESYGPMKLQVYDYDTFSADDIMGEAKLDVQPLITSAMAFEDAEMFGDMQIRKWLKSHDKPLIDDRLTAIIIGSRKIKSGRLVVRGRRGKLFNSLSKSTNKTRYVRHRFVRTKLCIRFDSESNTKKIHSDECFIVVYKKL
uniref:C2 domain-containing protein n=1 Tax=Brassica campestris TaxID=3711 RepID=M4E7L7_BRACM